MMDKDSRLLSQVTAKLSGLSKPDQQGWFTARCPFHDDTHPSLRFNDRGFRCMGCGEKGGLRKLACKLGIEHIAGTGMKADIVATYDYCDDNETLLFQVVRYQPKAFRQRRPDGEGGWIWKLEGVRRVLYRLPELVSSPKDDLVFIAEGEKDADNIRALGLVATCNPGGAGKFTLELRAPLKDRHVAIIADKDAPGRLHAQQVVAILHGFAASVKVLELPGDNVKDAADWIGAGGTAKELQTLADTAPAWKPVPGGAVLDAVATFIRRFVVITPLQATCIALWIAHTYALDAADTTPYIHVTSPEKRSGKTRLLEVLELLVHSPWFTGRVTAAVLARKVDAECPTLLLDESDAAFKGDKEYAETLRGILNTGHRRSGKTSICVGKGADITYRDLRTFCPKAIAGIGKLPDTVADRSIAIVLKRRTSDEKVERFRRRKVDQEAAPLRDRLAAWAAPPGQETEGELLEQLDDRAAEAWEPLLAIADAAGGEWPKKARDAALALSGSEKEDQSLGIRLLTDIRSVFAKRGVDRLRSTELVNDLIAIEEAPWSDLDRRALDAKRLAALLKPYKIKPDTVRFDEATAKGYEMGWFADAWKRYLPPLSDNAAVTPVTLATSHVQITNRNTDSDPKANVTGTGHVQSSFDVTDVTASEGILEGKRPEHSAVPDNTGNPGTCWMLEEWRRVSIPQWRHILKESLERQDVKNETYARWMLREILNDPEYREGTL